MEKIDESKKRTKSYRKFLLLFLIIFGITTLGIIVVNYQLFNLLGNG